MADGGVRTRGEVGRDCDCNIGGGTVVARVGWISAGVLIVRGRGASFPKEGLLA